MLFFKKIVNFINTNFKKIILIFVVHLMVYVVGELPYINLVKIYFSSLAYVIDIVLFTLLFKPKSLTLIYLIFTLLGLGFLSVTVNLHSLSDITGTYVYFLLIVLFIINLFDIIENRELK